jgi:hypothetical protein
LLHEGSGDSSLETKFPYSQPGMSYLKREKASNGYNRR